MNRIAHAASGRPIYCVARLVRPFADSKPLPAVLKHLRHEWEVLQSPILVERAQDLILTAHLNNVARSESYTVTHEFRMDLDAVPSGLKQLDRNANAGSSQYLPLVPSA